MTTNEKPPVRAGGDQESNNAANSTSNSAAAQRQRLLARLRLGPLTTLEARRELDVLHPAARVMELRKSGEKIDTIWAHDLNGIDRPHRVARYILQPGKVVA